MELTYNQVLELLPAYTLGALEPEEMLAVDTYLNAHEALLNRLRQAEQAAAQLAHAAPVVPLPAEAKDRLMSRIHADLASQEITEQRPQRAQKTQPTGPDSPTDGQLTGLSRLRSIFGSPLGILVTGAALVLLIVGLFYISQLQSQLDQAKDQLSNLEARVTELETNNVQLQQLNEGLKQQLQTNQDQLTLIANADPSRSVQIFGTAEAPDARGTLYVHEDQGLLLLQGLEELPHEKTYQLWLIPPANKAPVPAGLVEVNQDVPTWMRVQIPAEVQDFTAVGVSVEPAGGSPAPTGPIVLLSGQS